MCPKPTQPFVARLNDRPEESLKSVALSQGITQRTRASGFFRAQVITTFHRPLFPVRGRSWCCPSKISYRRGTLSRWSFLCPPGRSSGATSAHACEYVPQPCKQQTFVGGKREQSLVVVEDYVFVRYHYHRAFYTGIHLRESFTYKF